MAETYKITQKDVEVVGWYEEATKGTSPTGQAYRALRGIIQEVSFTPDDGRKPHHRSGDGAMASNQTWDQRKVSGKITYKLINDFESGGGADTSMIALTMGSGTLHTATGRILTRGTRYLEFTSGGTTEVTAGDYIEGGTSGATAIVQEVLVTSGTWGGGDAAGIFIVKDITGVFQSESLTPNYATLSGAQKQISGELKSYTLWVRQRNLPNNGTIDHVISGVHNQKCSIRGMENGHVEMEIDFKAFDWVNTAPSTSTLPTQPYEDGMPFFIWNQSYATYTLTRAGTEARINSWSIVIDNGELHWIPKDGQRYAADYVAGLLGITGDLDFFTNDTELYTLYNTDPNADKTLDYDSQTQNFTVGSMLRGQTSGATALIVDDTDSGATGTLKLRKITGVFADGEIVKDTESTPGSATVDGTLTDPSTIDFSIVLSKNDGDEYLAFRCYNTYPTAAVAFSHTPQEDAMWMIKYPFQVFRPHNFIVDVLS